MCSPNRESKDLPTRVTQALVLEHCSTHTNFIHVSTYGSKSDVGVGYDVIFPSFSRGGTLPPVASVCTAKLSAIVLALQIIFTLPVTSVIIF